MADQFATQIEIGGTLTLTDQNVEAFETFVSNLQELAPAWGETLYYLPDITELDETLKDGIIFGCNDQQSGGEFESLEIACQALGLQYDRQHDPKYEYDGESVSWRPGMESVHSCRCNADGKSYLLEEEVTAAINEELYGDKSFLLTERVMFFEKRINNMITGGVAPLEPFVLNDARTVKA